MICKKKSFSKIAIISLKCMSFLSLFQPSKNIAYFRTHTHTLLSNEKSTETEAIDPLTVVFTSCLRFPR